MQFKPAHLIFATVMHLSAFNALAAVDPDNPVSSVYSTSVSCTEPPFGLRLPPTPAKILQLDKVVRERVFGVKDWGSYKAIEKMIEFSGFRIDIITFSNDPSRYFVTHAEITDPKWQIAGPFRVGATVAETRKALGKLADRDPDLRSMYSSDTQDLYFQHSKGKITKIIYECYAE